MIIVKKEKEWHTKNEGVKREARTGLYQKVT